MRPQDTLAGPAQQACSQQLRCLAWTAQGLCIPSVRLAAWQISRAHRDESRATGERLRVYERRAGLRRGLRLGLRMRLQCMHQLIAPGTQKAGRTLQL